MMYALRERHGGDMSTTMWPELPWSAWSDTANTLHMWTQIVGKTRLALTPLQNHWWNVPLYVTARGLTTSAMDYGDDVLDIQFDFLTHELHMRLGSGKNESLALKPMSVADFYQEYFKRLDALGVSVKIWPMPVEVQNPIRFDLDTQHNAYDREYVHRFWQALVHTEKVFRAWAPGFLGKVSPAHFFWGSFDFAVTRFSGRPAPPREGADSIQREAYSTKSSPQAFGLATEDTVQPRSTAMPLLSPTACRRRKSRPPQPSGIKIWESTSSNTTMCGFSLRPTMLCWSSLRALILPPQMRRSGTGSCWTGLPQNASRLGIKTESFAPGEQQ